VLRDVTSGATGERAATLPTTGNAELPPPFRWAIHAEPDVVTVAPHGELDLASVPALDADLRDLRGVGFARVVLDLRGLTFIDGAGVHLLLRWAQLAARRRFEFRVIPGPDRVRLVFALTGVLDRRDADRLRWVA
jgi:anti-anti-sigma factor